MIGGWNTVFGYLAFVVLYEALHRRVHYLIIGVVAHVVAMINAFVAHRLVVFRSSRPWPVELLRFNVAQLGVLAGGLLALWGLVHGAGLTPLVAQAIVTVGAVAASYAIHRWFTFAVR